jgi:hypothetical protein
MVGACEKMEMFTNWLQRSDLARYCLTVIRVWLGFLWLNSAIEKMGSPVWTGNKAVGPLTLAYIALII